MEYVEMYEEISELLPKTVDRTTFLKVAGHLLRTGTMPKDYDTLTFPLPDITKLNTLTHRTRFINAVVDAFRWHEFGDMPQIIARQESEPSPYTHVFNLHKRGLDIGNISPYSTFFAGHTQIPKTAVPDAVQKIGEKYSCLYIGDYIYGKGVQLVIKGPWSEMKACLQELSNPKFYIDYLFVVYDCDEVSREQVLQEIELDSKKVKVLSTDEWRDYPHYEFIAPEI